MTDNDQRTVVRFKDNDNEIVQTVMSYTYGHTIPLTLQTTDISQTPYALKIDDSVPNDLIDQAKHVCFKNKQRYNNEC